ncbi:glycosyl hydrolase family 43 protein [Phyllosticta capitalensis]|uniref:Glycosyl hydrolase family 43 protein n=2 Tax=Phyllosticta capitalensis TaxID=121624 RepID=A0ABR1Y9S5_9PEZI
MRQSLAAVIALASVAQASLQIVPGATWTVENTGEHLQAHGAGIIEVDGTYYIIGEDKTNGSSFQNINCYSSTNLVEWSYVGALLTLQSSGDLGPDRVVERPKVIYNDDTSTYVMYMHIDDSSYGEAEVGVATSSSVCGSYEYQGSFQPLDHQSRDINLFKDDDGTGYLLTEDRENGLRIEKLSSDYLSVENNTYLFSNSDLGIEAPAMIKLDGTYYLFGSRLTGWDPNDNYYTTATSLSGPWSDWAIFVDEGSNTYDSQTNFVLAIQGSSSTTAVYFGDRWHSDALFSSTYVWLPLTIDGTSVSMKNQVNWIIDTATGEWSAGPSETEYEGEAATLSNNASSISCDGCSGGDAAGYIGGDSAPGGTATFSSVSSEASTTTTIRIKYQNLDSTARYAAVTVNGEEVGTQVAFLPTTQGTPGSSVINVALTEGDSNEIVIAGVEGKGYGPDVDRLMVPST